MSWRANWVIWSKIRNAAARWGRRRPRGSGDSPTTTSTAASTRSTSSSPVEQGAAHARAEGRFGARRLRLPGGRGGHGLGQRLHVPDRHDAAPLGESAGQLDLVIVDVLAELVAPGDDERHVALATGADDAADPGVGD